MRSVSYEIKVKGRVPGDWQNRLGAMQCLLDDGNDPEPGSTLIGQVRDQAELAGILNTLYELHLELLSVRRVDPEVAADSLHD